MSNNSFYFKTIALTAAFLPALVWLTNCAALSASKPNADSPRSSANDKNPITTPTPPPNINTEIEPLDWSKVPTVTYCELIKNPADYDRKIVRVRGIYFNGFERMFFYDEHCVKNEPPQAPKNIPAETWIQWDDDYRRKDVSEEAKTYHAVKSGERKDVTIVGKFYGTRDINNTGSGKHQLLILRVERILNIED